LLSERENIFIPERIVSEINEHQNHCDMENHTVEIPLCISWRRALKKLIVA
jgi:hypothetical protein